MTPSFDKDTARIHFSARDVVVAVASFLVCLGAAALVFASPEYLVAVSVQTMPRATPVVSAATHGAIASEDTDARVPSGSRQVDTANPGAVARSAVAATSGTVQHSATTSDSPEQTSVSAAAPARLFGTVVDAAGKPVRGATVVVVRYVNGVSQNVVTLVSAADGTFFTTLSEPSGTHRLIASVDVGGKNVRGSATLEPQSGQTYGVKITLIEKSYFMFLPIPGY